MENNNGKFGLCTWEDTNKSKSFGKREELPKFPYMRLQDGPNILRMVTSPYLYNIVRVKGANESGFGKKVNTAYPLHPDCPAIAAGFKPKERYLVGVIDRRDQELKIFDMSVLVAQQVLSLKGDIEWGDPEGYDLNIRKNSKSNAPANYYSVVPRPKTALSPADVELLSKSLDSLNKVLKLRTTPPKPETVLKRMQELGWNGEKVSGTVGEQDLADVDDDAYNFERPSAQA